MVDYTAPLLGARLRPVRTTLLHAERQLRRLGGTTEEDSVPGNLRYRFWSRSFALRVAAGVLIGSSIVLPVGAQDDEEMTPTEVVVPADSAEALPADAEALPAAAEATAITFESYDTVPAGGERPVAPAQSPRSPRQAPTPVR